MKWTVHFLAGYKLILNSRLIAMNCEIQAIDYERTSQRGTDSFPFVYAFTCIINRSLRNVSLEA